MKALVYTQPGELQLQERPQPPLQPGEVVLQIEAVGICGSDMHAWHGHDPRRQPGLVLGHEFAGRIVESAAPGFAAGTRWTGNPRHPERARHVVLRRENTCSSVETELRSRR